MLLSVSPLVSMQVAMLMLVLDLIMVLVLESILMPHGPCWPC